MTEIQEMGTTRIAIELQEMKAEYRMVVRGGDRVRQNNALIRINELRIEFSRRMNLVYEPFVGYTINDEEARS